MIVFGAQFNIQMNPSVAQFRCARYIFSFFFFGLFLVGWFFELFAVVVS